jgi:hypothetical protein
VDKICGDSPKTYAAVEKICGGVDKICGDPPKIYRRSDKIFDDLPKIYRKSKKISGRPEKISSRPGKISSRPGKIFGDPPKTYAGSEKIFGRPEKIFGRPEKIFGRPEKIFGRPEKIFSPPPKTYGGSRNAFTPSRRQLTADVWVDSHAPVSTLTHPQQAKSRTYTRFALASSLQSSSATSRGSDELPRGAAWSTLMKRYRIMSTSKAHTALSLVRATLELNTSTRNKLELCASFLAAQAQADPENKLGPQAAALSAAHQSLTAKFGLKIELQAKADTNNADIAIGIGQLDVALTDYTRAAARFAGSDPVVLGALGVTAAKKRSPKGAHPTPDAPTGLVIRLGARPGEAILKCRKVPYAGAYVFEYKLEPSLPAEPWLPDGGIQTKLVSATVSGLAPYQQIRARVRAIGALSSAWSEEVVGRTR